MKNLTGWKPVPRTEFGLRSTLPIFLLIHGAKRRRAIAGDLVLTGPGNLTQSERRRPGDRFYSAVQWTFLGLIVCMLIAGIVLPRIIAVPRPWGFRLFIVVMLCMNALWWTVADRRFARYLKSERWSRASRVLAAALSLAMNAPMVYVAMTGRLPRYFSYGPTWYAAAVTLWQIGLVVAMPIVAGLRLVVIGAQALVRKARHRPVVETNPSRRAFLKTSFATAPVAMLVGGVGASQMQAHRLDVDRHTLAAPWLPSRLKGLTITHVSDLHVGRLYRPQQLPALVEQVNRLDSDILLVTGDIVDVSNEMLPPALDAIGQMRQRYGVFACIGNHDEFDNRRAFIRGVRERMPLLLNERRTLEIGGEKLCISGVDWAGFDRRISGRPGLHDHVAETMKGYDESREGPMIAMAHHPHAWDSLALAGVPLTLSGHTHGGQIMLNPPDMRPDIGAGSLLFRYVRGFYRRGLSDLFVNRGVGNWFPLRVNSPAHIVQIQFV